MIGAITLTRPRKADEADGLVFYTDEENLLTAIATAVASLLGTLDAKREIEWEYAARDALFRTIAKILPQEVSFVDREFIIKYVNGVKRDKFSKEAEGHGGTLEGQKCHLVYEKKDHVCGACPIRDAMDKAPNDLEPVRSDEHYGRPEGKPVYRASVIASAIVHPHTGEVIGGVEVVTDRDERARQTDLLVGHRAHEVVTNLDTIRVRLATIEEDIDKGRIGDSAGLRQHLAGSGD